jgi:antitoxin component YwqK of YwqJK toxin-antitoxin module
MIRKCLIACIVFAGCQATGQREHAFHNESVRPAIPDEVIRSDDPLLTLRNGVWYYNQQPFSGIIETFFQSSGSLKSRQCFYRGREEGLLEMYYENGMIDNRRFFRNGEQDSIHTGWWPDGRLRFEYHFANGLYEGSYKEWYQNGQLYKHILYRAGKEQEGKGWRINGKPYMSFRVKNGRMFGLVNPNLCYTLKNERGEYVETRP